ncbi:exosome complex component RRP43-like [Dysidea avara]|uniref:exosome complex component RRP43-like n=1 Tax=Dysidea avara TaxID=196820 RepID=UPI00333002B0
MECAMLTQFTREFWTQCVKKDGHRPDGRSLLEYRNIGLNTGTLSHCEGSALVKLGSCIVLCGVKSELLKPIEGLDKPKTVVLTAYHHDKTTNLLYTEHLSKLFQQSTVLDCDQLWLVPDQWCWVLYVDCVSLTPSMSLDACILATTAALQNTQLPTVSINNDNIPVVTTNNRQYITLSSAPVAVTIARINDEMVADPSHEELEICDGTVCIISNNKDDFSELNTISVSGPIGDHDDVKKCLQAAPKLLLTIRTLLTSV